MRKTLNKAYASFPNVMTPAEMQKMLRCGRNKAYSLLNTNEIAFFCIGKNKFVQKADVISYIIKKTSKAS